LREKAIKAIFGDGTVVKRVVAFKIDGMKTFAVCKNRNNLLPALEITQTK
jgi:hypothetical protein